MVTHIEENDDGTLTYHVSSDALHAASMLDNPDAPELTEEQFDELTDEMRKAREETASLEDHEGSA